MAGLASSKNKSSISGVVLALLVLLAGSAVFGGVYFKKYQTLKEDSSKSAEQKNAELIEKINKVYSLPKDETPVVAVVSDEEKFKSEYPVFTTAKLGDSLLLYEKAAQAILYRDSENKVIGTAAFAVNSGASVHIIGPVSSQNTTQTKLEAQFAGKIRVASKATSTVQYATTTVFDASGNNTELADQIAAALGGSVSTAAPAGETIPDNTSIVIVMGQAEQSTNQ